MARSKDPWLAGLFRVTAAALSAGAALVSILSYTSVRAAEALGTAHRLAVTPAADTAAALGDTLQLAALLTDDRGGVLLGVEPVWASADPSVAEVDQAGTVVSRSAGSTAIIVRTARLEARARIVVVPRPVVLRASDTLFRIPEGERLAPGAEATDARGHPIVGAPVRWSTADAAIVSVDSLGEVLGVSPGRSTLTALLGDLRAELPVEVVPVPASITVLEGEEQRAPAGGSLGTPLTAQIVSRTGRPIPGAVAIFAPRGAVGTAVPEVDTADVRGLVSTVWTLGAVPGRQQLAVVVDGVPISPVVSAEADPVRANTRVALASEPVAGTAGDSLAEPLVVQVTDSTGAALADVPVAWSTPDRGTVHPLGARTDSLGEARALWRLGSRAGRQRIRVQVGNARTMPAFTAEIVALPARAESLVVRGGAGQAGAAGAPLARPVLVRAVDRYGNPVPDVVVQGTAHTGRLAEKTARTDSAGVARLRWTLGRAAGAQRLTVALEDGGASVELTARAAPGRPSRLAFVSPPGTATAGRALAEPLVLEVSDTFGNPVADQRVSLSATSGSLTPARAVTDSSGRVRTRWTPGAKPGTATLTGRTGNGDVQATRRVTLRRAP